MQKRNSKFIVLISIVSFTLLASACSTTSTTEPSKTSMAPTESATTIKKNDPFGKYDPPIEVTAVRSIGASVKYNPGEDLDNNVWTKEFLNTLGIKIKYTWTAPDAQYQQKLNLSIASGEIADITAVNTTQLKQMEESGQLEDLTGLYEQYAAPFTKEIMNQDGGLALKSATFKGKMLALPYTAGSLGDVLWIRMDWLKKLNLAEPKTMDDVLQISEAFFAKDPDGNGKNDTLGIAANKLIFEDMGSLKGFFNGYHAYPGAWIKNGSGKVVSGSIQPEIKPVLAKLRDLYKAGQIDKEFPVKDGGKAVESVIAGKYGIMFGSDWFPYYPFADGKTKDPNMEWKAFAIPSIDDKPAKVTVAFPVSKYFVVKKGAKHPEAAIKLLNLFCEKEWGKTADIEKYSVAKDGIELFKYSLVQTWPALKDIPDTYLALKDALETKDPKKLNAEQKAGYDKILDFMNGDSGINLINWATMRQKAPTDSSYAVEYNYKKENLLMVNAFYGAPTPTMKEKSSTLDKMTLEEFTKIIMGVVSVDDFDNFVTQWKKLGGDDITNEVNVWAETQK
ncbi:extracellular solute-binding protein [Paenibacillus alba]|uniref:Extracellular solute-binding protein n=1 Tax=Paenibacillus alba TaxID=1197127 RepID=A0ABU6FV33_9BACL|nr:extracellular solute-binding protein [Paenibacillus alba]MEC0225742.1 extracellular solute-binding protein [Paenibacillus alba]